MKLDPVEEHRRKQKSFYRKLNLAFIAVLVIYYLNPAPPGSDWMFKVGWFFASIAGWFTQLFR